MKFDLSKVNFSKNDRKLNIRIPNKLNKKLAYLLGIQIGDGFLKKITRIGKIDYLISYDGHIINEFEWYNSVLKNLLKELFNKEVQVRKTKASTVKIYFRSKAIFTFLNEICGISQSPKNNIKIPLIIMNSDNSIKKSFLRGLADTDFSLTFKKRKKEYYPVIDFQTSSKSLSQLTLQLIERLGFKAYSGFRKKPRYTKFHDSYYINISGRNQLDKWLKEIGFKSPNHITKYEVWKKLGYLPIGTNIIGRLKILKNEAHMGPLRP